MTKIIRALTIAVVLASASAAADDTAAPTMAAFVVGLESYRDSELNKLQYPAQDARDVFQQLQEISSFQKNRSRLLLAERAAQPDEVPTDPVLRRRRYWTAQEIRNEFREFLEQVKDNDLVVIYVGGHGFAARDQSLLLTASDFDPVRTRNDIPYSDLIGDLRRQIAGSQLALVRVAMFLNVCGAGNAGAMNVAPELVDAGRKLNQELQYGKFKYSLFPATARLQNAYEDDAKRKRSVFAHYLIEGLRGAAADKRTGAIMAGPLLTYIERGMNEFQTERGQPRIELPHTIDPDMVIGLTQRQQGKANYAVGMALLAAAREIAPSTGSELDRGARAAQSTLLTDLAIDQFTQALRRNPELKGRARLRRVQARFLNGASPEAEDIARDLHSLEAGSDLLTDVELAQMQALGGVDRIQTSGPATLKALRDELQAGQPFYTLMIDGAPLSDRLRSGLDLWDAFLARFPGRSTLPTIKLKWEQLNSEQSSLPSELMQTLQTASATAPKARLMVVYCCVAAQPSSVLLARSSRSSSAAAGARSPKSTAESLRPFGRIEIQQIARAWAGPVSIVLDAPFGGVLLEDPPSDIGNVSLLLAAQEPNGMTFGSPEPSRDSDTAEPARDSPDRLLSSTRRLIASFEEGSEDYSPDPSAVAKWQQILISDQNLGWVMGTPGWFPAWGKDRSRYIAEEHLEPLVRWAYLVSHGCHLEELTACDKAVAQRAPDPMQVLRDVAAQDLSGRGPEVSAQYRQIHDGLITLANVAARGSAGSPDSPLGTADTRAALLRAADGVLVRTNGASSKSARTIHVISMGVEDYKTPLIPDLPNTIGDLLAYDQALTKVLSLPGTIVEVHPAKVAATAREILETLSAVRDSMEGRPQDLAIFIFSGRGIELNGRRYLASAALDVLPDVNARPAGPQPSFIWNMNELVDLWQIGQLMQGRWFVGLYDAQFTAPIRQARADQILDKHVDSVRPRDTATALLANDGRVASGSQSVFLPRGEVPAKQVHIWVNGPVTAQRMPPHVCAPNKELTVSPLAAAVVSILNDRQPGTYRDVMKQLENHTCLRDQVSVNFQGDVDLPVFASGDGAELVEYFHSEDARRELNLSAAVAVTMAAEGRHSSVRHTLSDAALLVTLLQLFKKYEDILGVSAQHQQWLKRARSGLEEITLELLTQEGAEDLWPIRSELLMRLFELSDDPNEAIRVLHQADPRSILSKRNLARSLVDLTRAAIDQQSTIVLQKTESTLEGLKEIDPTATQRLNVIRQSERQRRAQVFSITQPRGEPSSAPLP
jgi:uncharacterized caspase-like protein